MTLRIFGKGIGALWIVFFIGLAVWFGFRAAFLGAPGLITSEGYGDISLFAICVLPGYLLYQWGNRK